MSLDRVPEGSTHVLLTLSMHSGMCTIQAIWDTTTITDVIESDGAVWDRNVNGISIYARRTKNSQQVSRETMKSIVSNWIDGHYVKVQSALFPDYPQQDWMS